MFDVFVITGGTGFIGKRLTSHLLKQGKKVYILTRQQIKSDILNLHYIQWDTNLQTINEKIAESQVCVVHLAGAGVAEKRWTPERKLEIKTSRTNSSATLYKFIKDGSIPAKHIVSASAIGFYAPSIEVVNEQSNAGNDYLATTCIDWENSVHQIKELNIPITILRIGLVMGAGGGAITEFAKMLPFKIAAIPGNGKQCYSWIHIDDMVNMILFAAEKQLNNTFNAVSVDITTCETLVKALAKAYCGGFYVPLKAPSFVIKIMLGEMSIEVLKSSKISNQKIIDTGFSFKYPLVQDAMNAIAIELKTK